MQTPEPRATARVAGSRAAERWHRSPTGPAALVLAGLLATAGGLGAQRSAVELQGDGVQRGSVVAGPIGGTPVPPAPTLDVESAPITVTLPSGKPYPAYLVSAYAPSSGLFWWTFQGAGRFDPDDRIADPPGHLSFFVSDREILGVELGEAPPALFILRSSTKTGSFAEGRQAALANISREAARIQHGTARWMRVVSLAKALPFDFYFDPDRAMSRLELRVRSIERRANGWRVVVEGRGGRVAELLLDPLFALLSAEERTARPEN